MTALKRILILQHTVGNTLGPLESCLKQLECELEYCYTPSAPPKGLQLHKHHAGLILLGGAQSVLTEAQTPYLIEEKHLIQEAIERELPVFGICLGAQLVASALGACVEKAPQKEIGWTEIQSSVQGQSDPIFHYFQGGTPQFQWHEDTFAIPEQATHLASSELNRDLSLNQAFCFGPKVLAVQFHLETSPLVIQEWLQVSRHLSEPQKEAIARQTADVYPYAAEQSQRLFSAFWQQALGTSALR